MNALTIIIFAGDEGWGHAFYGTDVSAVYGEAWDYYNYIVTNEALDEDEYVAKDILDFALNKPDGIPLADCRYYPRITYINAPTNSLYTDRIDWN